VASVIPALLLTYLSHRRDEGRTLTSWHALLCGISEQPEVPQAVILSLLDAARNDLLPTYLRPETDELGVVVEKLLLDVLHSSAGTPRHSLLSRLLQTPRKFLSIINLPPSPANPRIGYFLSDTNFSTALQGINSSFSLQIEKALHNSIFPPSEFEASLSLIQSVVESFFHYSETITSPMPDIFVLAHVLPRCWVSDDSLAVSIARELWSKWLAKCSSDCQASVTETIKIRLKNLISDTQTPPR
jgi:E3 ubiquitin-protein ligase listerin